MKSLPLSSLRSPLLLSLAAGTLGFALNGFGLPVFGGTEIVLGGWVTLLIVYMFGAGWGVLATALAFSRTWLVWGHPGGLICFTLEALVIGLLMHRAKYRVVKSCLLYWGVIGGPLATFLVFTLTDIPFPSNWAIVIKYPVNSLLMTMIAVPIFRFRPFRDLFESLQETDAETPLRLVLSRRFSTILALSIGALGLGAGSIFDRNARAQAAEELTNDGREVAIGLQYYLDRHQHVLQLIAETGNIHELSGPPLNHHLDVIRQNYPGFLTMLAADAHGQIIAASPAVGRDGRPMANSGLSISDRDYFQASMTTGRSYVSRVFRGRGFGGDLIVAMSEPVRNAAGRPDLLLEGSLNVGQLPQAIGAAGQLEGRTLIIVDATNRVVASTGSVALPPLSLLRSGPVHEAAHASPGPDTCFSFDGDNHGRNERFVCTRSIVPGYGWQIYLAEPIWNTQRSIAGYYFVTAIWSTVVVIVALLLARGTATEITRPLSKLADAMRQLAHQRNDAPLPAIPHAARELTEISQDLHEATVTLSNSNRQLRSAINERDQSHRQLQHVLIHLEDKVRERTAQLDEARRAAESANEAKSEFLASMSHELRTPLNVILGMSELVMERNLGPLTERQAEGVQSINESGRHLLELINDILDLSKIEAGMLELDFQPTEIAHLCHASIRFVTEIARKKNLTIRTVVPEDMAAIIADERRLKQILVNLLANAVKFTPAGGEVGLAVREADDGTTIRFEVWDTGIGIAPEHFERIFQPFRQIDSSLARQYAGTGLGLTLVRRMAQLHGGTVELESAPGRGSRFSVVLPLRRPADAPATPATTAAAIALPVGLSRLRILIAEDNDSNNLVYHGYFRTRNCELIMVANGREAVDRAIQEQPDLILMDVHMPEMDGLEATRRLRADPRTASIPIITVTALAMPEDRRRCLEAGASAYLTKPINFGDLGRLISRFAPKSDPVVELNPIP